MRIEVGVIVSFCLAVLLGPLPSLAKDVAPSVRNTTANRASVTHKISIAHRPSWFPKVSCEEAWQKQDKAVFRYKEDSLFEAEIGNRGYDSYEARLRSSKVSRTSCYKKWTVLVYMAADNDLSPYALWDLNEMEGSFKSGQFAGSTLRSDLVVQADTAGRTGLRRLHIFQRQDRDYIPAKGVEDFSEARIGEIQSPIAHFRPEPEALKASDHERELSEFLDWGLRKYPSEHYMVVVWGHGQGWASDPADSGAGADADVGAETHPKPKPKPNPNPNPFQNRFGGFPFSDEPGDYLGIPALARVFHRIRTTVFEGLRGIDLYASDACLMQMVEVANELADHVRFISGSSQMQSYLGLPYRQLMYEINRARFRGVKKNVTSADEPYFLARMLPKLSIASLDPMRGQQGRADQLGAESVTMSALSAAEMRSRLVPALHGLGDALNKYVLTDFGHRMNLLQVIRATPDFRGGSRELGSFVGLLKIQLRTDAEKTGETLEMQEVMAAAARVEDALKMTLINYAYGYGYRIEARPLHLLGFRSVGIWLPRTPAEYEKRRADFAKSKLYAGSLPGESGEVLSAWGAWLETLFGH